MNLELKIPEKINIDNFELQKMIFINNALEQGWKIEKTDNKYIFTKKHENLRQYYLDNYLSHFISQNLVFNEHN